MTVHPDEVLEPFFAAARADAPQVSPALMARVLADAERERPARRSAPWFVSVMVFARGFAAGLRPQTVGLGGLAAACVAVALWVTPPQADTEAWSALESLHWEAEALDAFAALYG